MPTPRRRRSPTPPRPAVRPRRRVAGRPAPPPRPHIRRYPLLTPRDRVEKIGGVMNFVRLRNPLLPRITRGRVLRYTRRHTTGDERMAGTSVLARRELLRGDQVVANYGRQSHGKE